MARPRQGASRSTLLLILALIHSLCFPDSTEIGQLPPIMSEEARDAFYDNDLEKIENLISNPTIFNDPEAAYYSAMLLVRHDTSLDSAYKLFNSAAMQNHQGAMFQLAQMYENGNAVEQNLVSALEWYHKSELQSVYPPSIENLIVDNFEIQSPTPEVEIIKTLNEKAKNNDALAQFQLGLLFEKGQWVDANWETAVHWYELASKNGNDQASLNMGLFYCRGIYFNKDINKANNYFNKTDRSIKCN